MKLIITEKPIAAKRVAEILGKPKISKHRGVECYELPAYDGGAVVVPLKGHIVNVDFEEKYKNWNTTNLAELIDSEIQYLSTQKAIIASLEDYAKKCNEVIIACDYDREGESIGKEALNVVKKANPPIKIKRAKFSAFTQSEVKNAFKNLVDFDDNLANSADTRREVDLIWGAVLTRFISLSSRRLGKHFLSVGRVQTPALALTVNREKEIKVFKPKPFWVISLLCKKDNKDFTAIYEEEKIFEKEKADRLAAMKFDSARVLDVKTERRTSKPPSPFNTTDFLRAAANIGFQPQYAMSLAETLYMSGYVSYPRTDNTVYHPSLDIKGMLSKFKDSDFSKEAAKLLAQKKLKPTEGKKKATDHPPIHPVEVASKAKLSLPEWKVYELIVRRFMATLAPNAEIETVTAHLDYNGKKFKAHGLTILKQGWKEFYPYSKTDEEILPELEKNENVTVENLECKKDKTKPKPRYSPATLIKLMDQFGLGTKATRPGIIQKLHDRGYLSGTKQYIPSETAFALIDTLDNYVNDITTPEMTSDLENDMDMIENGKKEKEKVVEDSRKILHKVLSKLEKHNESIGDKMKEAARAESELGKCPECKKGMLKIITTPRHTRFVGCSSYPECTNSFPLPAKGKIVDLNKKCTECKLPMIRVFYSKYKKFDMCINHKCPSKKDWGKKKRTKKITKGVKK